MAVALVTALACCLIALAPVVVAAQTPYEGFGATTPGGTGKPIYRVTNLNNSGAGSLRDAVSQSNRNIVFDVAGTIDLASEISIRGSFITIDGSTAPAPGITIRNAGLGVEGGGHDIVIKYIRVRNASDDGFFVFNAHDIVFDHVSSHGSADGNLDITESSFNVTVQWSLFAEPAGTGNMLIKYNPSRVTVHHNLFVASPERNPQVRIDDAGTQATETTADVRNNVVWDWGPGWGYGARVWFGPWANVVNNFYQSPASANQAIMVSDGARAYVSGNVSGNGQNLNVGNTATAFAAPAVVTDPTCVAAAKVLQQAGVRPLDSLDQGYVARVSLANCPGAGDSTPPANPANIRIE